MYQNNDLRRPIQHHFSKTLEVLMQAYTQEKPGVFLVSCDEKPAFLRFRPHTVIGYAITAKDPNTGAISTISHITPNNLPFTMLFRIKEGKMAAFIVFEDGRELSSDGPTDFVAYFAVKMNELDSLALYTVTKFGCETCCTETYSTAHTPPAKFCQAVFSFLGGSNYE